MLNVTEDHMDRYPFGLQQYRAAKLRVYEKAKVCVVNADDALTMPVRGADERCVSFGVNMGDYHLNRQQGETWLRVKGEKVLNVKEMKLSGQHNYTNALAALALADAVGLPRASSLKALTTFTGLAHRFQLALEHKRRTLDQRLESDQRRQYRSGAKRFACGRYATSAAGRRR